MKNSNGNGTREIVLTPATQNEFGIPVHYFVSKQPSDIPVITGKVTPSQVNKFCNELPKHQQQGVNIVIKPLSRHQYVTRI
jgi:hypothetical protein